MLSTTLLLYFLNGSTAPAVSAARWEEKLENHQDRAKHSSAQTEARGGLDVIATSREERKFSGSGPGLQKSSGGRLGGNSCGKTGVFEFSFITTATKVGREGFCSLAVLTDCNALFCD